MSVLLRMKEATRIRPSASRSHPDIEMTPSKVPVLAWTTPRPAAVLGSENRLWRVPETRPTGTAFATGWSFGVDRIFCQARESIEAVIR